jgi:hypothetical protein
MGNNFNKDLLIKISKKIKKDIMTNINVYYNDKESFKIYNQLNLYNENDDNEIIFLSNIINIVKENNSKYSDEEIYITVIYLYYALVLNEPLQNYLLLSDIKYITNRKSYDKIIYLFFEISSSDKQYCSKIRKIFFNFI